MPSPKTMTSTVAFQDSQGNVVANGNLVLTLSQSALVTSGGGLVAPKTVTLALGASGLISGSPTLWANDQLTPSGTTYFAELLDSGGNIIATFGQWNIAGASPIDLSQMTPVSTSTVSNPAPVLLSPSGNQTITSGNLTLSTGAFLAENIGSVLYVGPGGYATIAAAVTAASTNKTAIIVQSNYAGTECPSFVSNITYFDFRGISQAAGCTQNVQAYGTNDGVVNAGVKEQYQSASIPAGGTFTARWPLAVFNNGTVGTGIGIDGIAPEVVLNGTLTGTLPTAQPIEAAVAARTTGGAITTASNVAYVTGTAGGTAITNVRGWDGVGCQSLGGANNAVTNCFGLYGRAQGTQATGNNYAIGSEGKILLKWDSTQSTAGLDMEDNTNTKHSFVFTDGSNGTNIQAITTQGIRFNYAGGGQAAGFNNSTWTFNNSVLPSASNTWSLGSAAFNWFALHLSANSGSNDNALIGNAAATNANTTMPKSSGTLVSAVGSTLQKSETGADTNVLTFTPPALTGNYRICISMAVSAQNTATLGWTATWTDSNGSAQAPTNLALFQTGVAAPALTFTAATNGNYTSCHTVDVNNSATAIVVKTTFTGTSIAYKVSATVEGLQ